MLIEECMGEPVWAYCAAAAWFIQMGVHEGMHAETAYRLGDDTASLLGKRTLNPLAHIDWGNPMSVLLSVILPVYTAFTSGVALGMAWVPVNPYRFRNMYRDSMIVALAGPAGNFALCAVCLLVHFLVLPLFPPGRSLYGVEALFASIYLTSAVYGVFNLIPVPPLDGSRVIYWRASNSVRDFLDRIAPFGLLIVILLFRVFEPLERLYSSTIAFFFGLYS